MLLIQETSDHGCFTGACRGLLQILHSHRVKQQLKHWDNVSVTYISQRAVETAKWLLDLSLTFIKFVCVSEMFVLLLCVSLDMSAIPMHFQLSHHLPEKVVSNRFFNFLGKNQNKQKTQRRKEAAHRSCILNDLQIANANSVSSQEAKGVHIHMRVHAHTRAHMPTPPWVDNTPSHLPALSLTFLLGLCREFCKQRRNR